MELMRNLHFICRVCAVNIKKRKSTSAISIFGNPDIIEKMRKYLDMELTSDDQLPKIICNNCFKRLESIHNFATLAKKTENFLKEFLNIAQTRFKNPNLTQNPQFQNEFASFALLSTTEGGVIIEEKLIPDKDEFLVNFTPTKNLNNLVNNIQAKFGANIFPQAPSTTVGGSKIYNEKSKDENGGTTDRGNKLNENITNSGSSGASNKAPMVQKNGKSMIRVKSPSKLNEYGNNFFNKMNNKSGTGNSVDVEKVSSQAHESGKRNKSGSNKPMGGLSNIKDLIAPFLPPPPPPPQMLQTQSNKSGRSRSGTSVSMSSPHMKLDGANVPAPPQNPFLLSMNSSNQGAQMNPTSLPTQEPSDPSVSDGLNLGCVIKDLDLLKLILKALKWPYTEATLTAQIQRLKSSRFRDIMIDPNLLQDEDLMQILRSYLSPILLQQQQQQQQILRNLQQQQQSNLQQTQTVTDLSAYPTVVSYKIPADTSVRLISVDESEEQRHEQKQKELQRLQQYTKTKNFQLPLPPHKLSSLPLSSSRNSRRSMSLMKPRLKKVPRCYSRTLTIPSSTSPIEILSDDDDNGDNAMFASSTAPNRQQNDLIHPVDFLNQDSSSVQNFEVSIDPNLYFSQDSESRENSNESFPVSGVTKSKLNSNSGRVRKPAHPQKIRRKQKRKQILTNLRTDQQDELILQQQQQQEQQQQTEKTAQEEQQVSISAVENTKTDTISHSSSIQPNKRGRQVTRRRQRQRQNPQVEPNRKEEKDDTTSKEHDQEAVKKFNEKFPLVAIIEENSNEESPWAEFKLVESPGHIVNANENTSAESLKTEIKEEITMDSEDNHQKSANTEKNEIEVVNQRETENEQQTIENPEEKHEEKSLSSEKKPTKKTENTMEVEDEEEQKEQSEKEERQKISPEMQAKLDESKRYKESTLRTRSKNSIVANLISRKRSSRNKPAVRYSPTITCRTKRRFGRGGRGNRGGTGGSTGSRGGGIRGRHRK